MCKTRSASAVLINGKKVRVDTCLKPIIQKLNDVGYITVMSCCGHSKYAPTILYRKYDSGSVYDFLTPEWMAYGNKRFYKKDSEGYFYVPELEERLKRLNERRQTT